MSKCVQWTSESSDLNAKFSHPNIIKAARVKYFMIYNVEKKGSLEIILRIFTQTVDWSSFGCSEWTEWKLVIIAVVNEWDKSTGDENTHTHSHTQTQDDDGGYERREWFIEIFIYPNWYTWNEPFNLSVGLGIGMCCAYGTEAMVIWVWVNVEAIGRNRWV